MTENLKFHLAQIAVFETKIKHCKKQLRNIFVVRLLTFVAALSLLIYTEFGNSALMAVTIFSAVVIFLLVARNEGRVNNKILFYNNHIDIHSHEILLVNGDLSTIETGARFIEDDHAYAKDLDVFGMKSIYQLLNRTCTYSGAEILGKTLNHPPLDKEVICARQEAVKELASMETWCHDFLAHGKGSSEKNGTVEIITTWLSAKTSFNLGLVKVLRIVGPVFSISFALLGVFHVIGFGMFWLVVFTQLFITVFYTARINAMHNTLSKKFSLIDKYLDTIRLIESQKFTSPLLQNLQRDFAVDANQNKATQTLGKLKSYLDLLDARLNVLMAIALNGFSLWDLNTAYKIERWKAVNKDKLSQWIQAISEFDALISIALFSKANPNYVYPEILSGALVFSAEGIGHPLVNKSKLVKNNYHIEGAAKIDLLTGANMAGKSTFLRTVGVNVVLGRIGAVVCADRLSFTPMQLFTSLRTSDSLQENESFFYAELKRLERLIKMYQNNSAIFFLLDEILKGTNSKDQHFGSVGLIKKILLLRGSGIIATHDLALSSMEEEYPQHLRNLCFEIEIENNELIFDYKLKLGFCKTMNASFLMKKMDII